MIADTQIINVNNHDLHVKEINGERVVTFKDIDILHERPEGTARKRFHDNRNRFIDGEDYYKISPSEFRTAIGNMDARQQNDVILITKTGYLMLVKSFTDELAWKVQRILVNSYFQNQAIQNMIPLEAVLEQLVDMRTTFIQMLQSEHSEMVRRHTEILNGQRLMHKYVKSIWNACRPEFHVSEWKNEVYKLASQIQEAEPEKYKNNKAVLSEYYKEMRDVYGFVAEQSAKEFKERNRVTYNPYTIDLIAADAKLRDIFMNLLKERAASLASKTFHASVKGPELGPPKQELEQPGKGGIDVDKLKSLIEKSKDASCYGVVTYRRIYENMMDKGQWDYVISGYKQRHAAPLVKKIDIIKENSELTRLFNVAVNKMLERIAR